MAQAKAFLDGPAYEKDIALVESLGTSATANHSEGVISLVLGLFRINFLWSVTGKIFNQEAPPNGVEVPSSSKPTQEFML
jgi:hypothetical protein